METTQSLETQTQKKLSLSLYKIYMRFLNAPEGLEFDQVKV